MKILSIACMILFLGCGWGWAAVEDIRICVENLDISKLPQDDPFIKKNLSDLADYFTCKAAVSENIQICNDLSNDPKKMAECQDTYNRYYVTYGKLYKNGRVSEEFLDACLKKLRSRTACVQFADVLLSGYTENCDKIAGITQANVDTCKNMASSEPVGTTRGRFMMILRKGDPGLCDEIENYQIASVCKGILWKNTDGCQLNAGVDRFKEHYCQHLST